MSSSNLPQRLFIPLMLVATWIAYLPALHGGFVWDDSLLIVENQVLRDLDGLRRIWFERGATTQYYPLVFSTYWIEYHLWQLQPSGYHAVNILLHSGNALLVWVLLRKLSVAGAWLAAVIFALHPVHVESVAWISERKNVLSGLFYLSAALSYLRFRGLAAGALRRNGRFYFVALLLFVFALLSKSVTASLPAALLLVIYWKEGRIRTRDVALLLPFFALGIAAGLNTAWMERAHVGAAGAEWDFTVLERGLIASRALWFYPAKLLWPQSLTFSYPRWGVDASQWWQYLFGAAVICLLALLWLLRSRLGRGPLVAALFFVGTLFPALGFVNLYPMRFSFVADHFQYLASLGLIAPLAAGVARATGAIERIAPGPGRLFWYASIGLVLIALGSQSLLQSRIYRDEETVWRDTLQKNPDSWMAHNNLGRILGLRLEHEQAAKHFRRAVELKQDYYVAETNLAEALIHLGEYREAVRHLRHVLEIQPAYADAHHFAWIAFKHLGQLEQAAHHLRWQRALQPSFEGHYEAARLLASIGRPRDALLELELAESFRPQSAAVAFRRGNIYMALDEPRRAVAAFRAATVRSPDWAWAQNNLGQALERLGALDQAELHYANAVRINPNHEVARQNLARLRSQRHGSVKEEREAPRPSPRADKAPSGSGAAPR